MLNSRNSILDPCHKSLEMFHGDHTNMPCIDWINHVVLDGGCAR